MRGHAFIGPVCTLSSFYIVSKKRRLNDVQFLHTFIHSSINVQFNTNISTANEFNPLKMISLAEQQLMAQHDSPFSPKEQCRWECHNYFMNELLFYSLAIIYNLL